MKEPGLRDCAEGRPETWRIERHPNFWINHLRQQTIQIWYCLCNRRSAERRDMRMLQWREETWAESLRPYSFSTSMSTFAWLTLASSSDPSRWLYSGERQPTEYYLMGSFLMRFCINSGKYVDDARSRDRRVTHHPTHQPLEGSKQEGQGRKRES